MKLFLDIFFIISVLSLSAICLLALLAVNRPEWQQKSWLRTCLFSKKMRCAPFQDIDFLLASYQLSLIAAGSTYFFLNPGPAGLPAVFACYALSFVAAGKRMKRFETLRSQPPQNV